MGGTHAGSRNQWKNLTRSPVIVQAEAIVAAIQGDASWVRRRVAAARRSLAARLSRRWRPVGVRRGRWRVLPSRARTCSEWLSYIASDELQGRAVYSAGIGLAAAYIEDHLKAWGVKPAGDHGGYLQTVRVLGVKTTSATRRSPWTSTARPARSRTATGITLPKNMGGKRRFTVDRVEFAGYGLDAPAANHMDYRGKDVKNAVVVWLGASGPKGLDRGDLPPCC